MKDKIKGYRRLSLILLLACLAMTALGWFFLPESCLAPFTQPNAIGAMMDKTTAVAVMAVSGLAFDAAFYFTKGKRVFLFITVAELLLFVCLFINNL